MTWSVGRIRQGFPENLDFFDRPTAIFTMEVIMNTLLFDIDLVRKSIQTKNLSYPDIAIMTAGRISVSKLKYAMNKKDGRFEINEADGALLAEILEEPIENLLRGEYYAGCELPKVAAMLTRKLYSRSSHSIHIDYLNLFQRKRQEDGYRKLIEQADTLFNLFLVDNNDRPDHEERIMRAISLIGRKCLNECELFSPLFLMGNQYQEAFQTRLGKLPNRYTIEYTLLTFTYALTLFDSVFFHELLFSAVQFCPTNFSSEAEEYSTIALAIENLRSGFIDFVLTGTNAQIVDTETFEAMGHASDLMENTILLLTACGMVSKHQESPYFASEYINRVELFAIVKRIEIMLTKFGCPPLPAFIGIEHFSTNFGKEYLILRSATKQKKAIQKNVDNQIELYFKMVMLEKIFN